ncbi:MAG TPA: 3-oxoacyl-[acyl-carrier-protein] synthase III C-terminal domain-containing protein [Polyangiaceae bacterium]|nr:3-oxoacyl-[acyl-carrier-protein] synthase III C-terminal domain-containing protein [Polyangiaceae bacterium]
MISADCIVLTDFRPTQLQRPVAQEALLNYTAWLLATAGCAAAGTRNLAAANEIMADTQATVLRYGINPRHIAQRQLNALPQADDELGATGSSPTLPPLFADLLENPGGPELGRRMSELATLALRVFRDYYARQPEAPDHLVHVTCSDHASPSAAQRWVSERGWALTTVTDCQQTGCYATFSAIRSAVALLARSIVGVPKPRRRVDIVHTEYLSVHFDPLQRGPGSVIDSTLFGDGFIGYSAFREARFSGPRTYGLRILAQHEVLIPDSLDEMRPSLGARNFEVLLSKNVPLLLEGVLPSFLRRLCAKAGRDFEREKDRMLFAIHPGGPKILDYARDALALSEAQIRHSRAVFRGHGNMSSATIPHVLMNLAADPSVPCGTPILAAAFGPGLTVAGLILERVQLG